MTPAQLKEYDLFLDENDWDIYYWATQEDPSSNTVFNATAADIESGAASSSSSSSQTASGSKVIQPSSNATFSGVNQADLYDAPTRDQPVQSPRPGEWAQTVGTFKPAYRPVPKRWEGSEILKMLREHVRSGRGDQADKKKGDDTEKGKGFAFMPALHDTK